MLTVALGPRSSRMTYGGTLVILAALLAVAGCQRSAPLGFEESTEIAELPERHQKNISDALFRFFGTPANPWQRMIDPEAEDLGDDELPPLVDLVDTTHLSHGARVYNARCAGCHGVTGDGAGPAGRYLRPRPRDYRKGVFKFTSTPYGMKPVRQDLVRTIRRGAKGTSMPAFPLMRADDLEPLIDYVILLSQRGETEDYVRSLAEDYEEEEDIEFADFLDAIESTRSTWESAAEEVVLPSTAEPRYGVETVTAGRELFLREGCSSCHGADGKGQTEWLDPEFLMAQSELPDAEKIKINYDAWGEPAPAADLTSRLLHGGRRGIDIYRRIDTGINGTPMPAFAQVFAQNPEKVWNLVHYVRHVIEGGDPTVGIQEAAPASEESDTAETHDEEGSAQ